MLDEIRQLISTGFHDFLYLLDAFGSALAFILDAVGDFVLQNYKLILILIGVAACLTC